MNNPIYKKKEHRIIDDVEHKHCSDCDSWKQLAQFSNNSSNWDDLSSICKQCSNGRMKEIRKHTKRLSEEEWKQSYVARKEKMREGVKRSYEQNPKLKEEMSKRHSKAIIAINENNQHDVLEFCSALEAKKHGFQNSNIGQAIKYNKPYKGYRWKFK